jgi:hypothetical protein
MNKKDFSALRRQFKTDNYQLELKLLYTVYMKKDNQNLLHAEFSSFNMKSEAEQEIYFGNFKKLLTGSLNSKIFELSFETDAPTGEGQDLCRELLDAKHDDFVECCNKYIAKFSLNYTYDSDIVISFVSGKYNKPTGRKSRKGEEESLGGFDDASYGFEFVMCSVSKADAAKCGIFYNAATERFDLNSPLDQSINFSAPIDGFMFPALSDNCSDINKLIYYTAKPNVLNEALLANVLYCTSEPTAKEEREKFEEIIRLVNGEKINTEIIKNIYDAVNEKLEAYDDASEPVTLDAAELRDIFEESGMKDLSGFEDAFSHTAEQGFEFKAASLVSGISRSLKISSGIADILVSLESLGSVKQVINAKGRKCLQIELDEDAEFNGMALETEDN